MSAPQNVIPLTPADIARFEAFHMAEMEADAGGRPLVDEMIAAVEHERARLGASARVANQVYGAPFDPATLRRYVTLRYLIDLLERVFEHKREVAPILYPAAAAPKRRRA